MLRAFRDLRISIKALLPLVLLSLVGLGVGGLIGRAMMTTDTHYSELLEQQNRAALHSARLDSITLNLGRALWRAIALPEADNVALSMREIDAMEAAAAAEAGTMRKAMEGTSFVATIGDLEREFQTIRAAALRSLRTLQAGQAEDAVKIVRAEVIVPFGKLREATTRLTATLVAASDARSAALTDETHAAVRTSLLSLGLGIVLSLGFGIWLTRAAILRPFARLDHAMQRLAGGDLTVEVADTDRRDEVGRMAQALQGFAVGLREATSLRGEQETLKLRAEEDRKSALLALAGNLESSVGGVVDGIASAASELTAAATSMVGIAEATSGRAGTVSSATAIASGNVGTVAAATEELAASVAEISRQVSDSARMAAGAVDQANRTNTTVANLTEAAAKIGEVTRLIGDIAAQTNLLALNATIEAARAGEAGKGFAVVASEVKALANQTAQATGSIATQIQAMQAATRDAASDIGAIRDSIGQINQVTAAIAAAVEEQGAATRDIAENVQRAAVGTSEIASAIDGVTSAAAETGGAAGQVQATSAILAQQAETLRLEVGNFLGRVRAA